MIYFIFYSYSPNTADANRALAYFRNLDLMKIPITVVFFMPDEKRSKISEEYQYISIKYYWDKFFLNNRFFKPLFYLVFKEHFLRKLNKGDKVYHYGMCDISKKLVDIEGVDVYYECTESPEIYLPSPSYCKTSLEDHIDICKKFKALFVISSALKDFYVNKGIEKEKIHIINMTVDPNRFEAIKNSDNKEPYFAYCGVVSFKKDGVNYLLRAFSILLRHQPDIKLYLVGPMYSPTVAEQIAKLMDELNIKDNIVLCGSVPYERIPQILKDAVALVLARPDNIQAKYGFPTKLGEYLLTGNPTIVTNVGDIGSFLSDKVNALIVPPNDYESLAERMCWVLSHPEEGEKIGKQGKNTALHCFNASIETKKLIEVISRL